MNLGAEFSRSIGASTLSLQGYAVGPAPIGPPVFMHRPSAAENPQAPLSHHYLDATHITPGVVTIGLERAGFKFEAGAFHGQEPDENRLDLDTAALDSYGVRLSWADGPWAVQLSGADLKTPERKSPYDATRVTASVSYFKGDANRSIAWLAAFGQNREVFGNLEAYLIEATQRVCEARVLHARRVGGERHSRCRLPSDRHGPHASAIAGRRPDARLRARCLTPRWGTLGVGGDVTGYLVPDNLSESYGSPCVIPRIRALSRQGRRRAHARCH